MGISQVSVIKRFVCKHCGHGPETHVLVAHDSRYEVWHCNVPASFGSAACLCSAWEPIVLRVECQHAAEHGAGICLYCGFNGDTLHRAGAKDDAEKLRMDLLPPIAIQELARVLTYGARKYLPNGWRSVDDADKRYTAALLRHLMAAMRGERIDPESGLTHLSHVLCNAVFLVELDGGSQ